jgi:hypothetical protein
MRQTTNYDLPYPESSDPINVAGDIESLAWAIDNSLGDNDLIRADGSVPMNPSAELLLGKDAESPLGAVTKRQFDGLREALALSDSFEDLKKRLTALIDAEEAAAKS